MSKYFTWAWMSLGVAVALGQFYSVLLLNSADRRSLFPIFFGLLILVFLYRHATKAKPLNRYIWILVSTLFVFFQHLSSPREVLDAFVIAGAAGTILTLVVMANDFVVKPLWQNFTPAHKRRSNTVALLPMATDMNLAKVEKPPANES